jgi:hypothetical protein
MSELIVTGLAARATAAVVKASVAANHALPKVFASSVSSWRGFPPA